MMLVFFSAFKNPAVAFSMASCLCSPVWGRLALLALPEMVSVKPFTSVAKSLYQIKKKKSLLSMTNASNHTTHTFHKVERGL